MFVGRGGDAVISEYVCIRVQVYVGGAGEHAEELGPTHKFMGHGTDRVDRQQLEGLPQLVHAFCVRQPWKLLCASFEKAGAQHLHKG